MNIKTGQHVKCILRNGALAEGIVEEWYANEAQLRSLDGESILIITHPTEDIMLIKVMLDKPKNKAEEIADRIRSQPVVLSKEKLEKEFEEAREATDPNNIDEVKNLAQLRIELNQQERKIIAEKLKTHHAGAYDLSKRGKLKYEYPDFKKISKK